ncbi:SigE family RNA polymerase sigma factor [Knoellia subterranea]|uniref:RNA polymerase sigma24 factor n=1 Tax=Knoellia subterranea KCTC 19937 TaxID=1385521 RepID=A0A0A0JKX2_9MICO|nr:SigE family RNA polymerase sigma factor [Knoellia subterranea]KGN37404.1 RNA polymerase sigma24 factor [Knoellia subterranea KCTC 19937]
MTNTAGADLDGWLDAAMPRIYGLAYALAQDRHQAEDLSQEALATVVSKWRTVSRADNPTAYARQIVVNTFLSQKRKRWTREVVSDAVVTELVPATDDLAGGVVERGALVEALRSLPPRQCTAVTLRYFEDLPDADVAALMGCSVSTVRSSIHHALAALRARSASFELTGVTS